MLHDRKKIWLKRSIAISKDYRHMLESRMETLPARKAQRLKRVIDYVDLHTLFLQDQLRQLQQPKLRIAR